MTSDVNILVSLDQNYLSQLYVLLTSVHLNNPSICCRVFLLHRGFEDKVLKGLEHDLEKIGYGLEPVFVDEALFRDAPVMEQYPQEMYYRLLAAQILAEDIDRVLYLDPDILVINSIEELWKTDMGNHLFAAAAHTGKTELANGVNRLRLGTEKDYYNSGVLLINMDQCRRRIIPGEIFSYISQHARELVLPDQDVLNALYGQYILPLEDVIWNYDARNYSNYLMRSLGKADLRWVMEHTSILHFCGKDKPWNERYRYRFRILYLHYMHLAEIIFGNQ